MFVQSLDFDVFLVCRTVLVGILEVFVILNIFWELCGSKDLLKSGPDTNLWHLKPGHPEVELMNLTFF